MIEKTGAKEEPKKEESVGEHGNACDETPMSFTALADKLYVLGNLLVHLSCISNRQQ